MSSDNIASSKKDSLFLNEYMLLDKNKKALSVKEAWVEYAWRNETIALGIAKKKAKTGGLSLNLILEDTSRYFAINNYSKTWIIENYTDQYMGLINGHCYLSIDKTVTPDSIYLIVSKKDSVGKYNDFEDVIFVKK